GSRLARHARVRPGRYAAGLGKCSGKPAFLMSGRALRQDRGLPTILAVPGDPWPPDPWQESKVPLAFGDFAFDRDRRQLLRAGEPVPLEPKAYDLLGLLLERRPNAVPKAQIRDAIWPATAVSDTVLAGVVTDLRAALDDSPREQRFIRTVHGFGYAFCGEAAESPNGHKGQAIPAPTPTQAQ